jgi:hypothetical protein
MPQLKLAKLPDRTPVKFSITVSPELAQALRDYAAQYERQFGVQENITALVPFMLAAFIESDAGFRKAKRDRLASAPAADRDRSPRVQRRDSAQSPSITSTED